MALENLREYLEEADIPVEKAEEIISIVSETVKTKKDSRTTIEKNNRLDLEAMALAEEDWIERAKIRAQIIKNELEG